MASLDIGEYSSSLEEMFPFPSSPDDQLAIFSSSGEEDFELGVYDQKPHTGKVTNVASSRAQRQAAVSAVPSLDSVVQKKPSSCSAPGLSMSDICNPKTYPLGVVLDITRGIPVSQHVQPSSVSSSSRIKSTPPNLPLLFSLFSVLEGDGQSPSPSSSPSSSSSSLSPSSSRKPSPHSSPALQAATPSVSTVAVQVAPEPVIQWMSPLGTTFQDRTSLLSNLADVLN